MVSEQLDCFTNTIVGLFQGLGALQLVRLSHGDLEVSSEDHQPEIRDECSLKYLPNSSFRRLCKLICHGVLPLTIQGMNQIPIY